MIKCPYCFEEIQEEAIICKHCGKKQDTKEAIKLKKEIKQKEEAKKREEEKNKIKAEKERLKAEELKKKQEELEKERLDLIEKNKDKLSKYPDGYRLEIEKDIKFLRKLENFNDEDIKKDIQDRRNNNTLIVIVILSVICFIIDPITILPLFLILSIWFYPNRNFSQLKEAKKHIFKIIFSILFLIISLIGIGDHMKDTPEIKVLSGLENGKNVDYTLKLNLKNYDELKINGEKIEFKGEKFEKTLKLEKPETEIKIYTKNGIYKENIKEIIIKREKTDEEIKKEKDEENRKKAEEKAKLEQEKQQKELEKKELPGKIFENNKFSYGIDCKESIKTLLKFPKTANFETPKYFYTGTYGKEAIIKGSVEAKNAFGVPSDYYYECVFTWDAERELYNYKYGIY